MSGNSIDLSESGRSGDFVAEHRHESQVFVASQWRLMWWRFICHRVAVGAAIFLVCLYILAIFADFFTPYLPNTTNLTSKYMPPQRLHFLSEDGFSLRPFVYGITPKADMITGRRLYLEDKNTKYPIYFFVRAESYRLFAIFETDVHLFGPAQGGVLYLLGTDGLGRDMLSQIIHGARVSLSMGLLGVLMSVMIGIMIGGVSGYFGGIVDNIVQRGIEVIRSFPTLALWMALSAALPRHWTQIQIYFAVVVILSVVGWTSLAREVRGKMHSLRHEDFMVAARLNGSSTMRIIRVHMVPSFMSHIIATLTLSIPRMILGETALSFLGVGLARPVVSWGVLLQQSQSLEALFIAPWLFLPGVVLVMTVLAFNFLGDGLRDAADPYSKLK